MPNAKEPGRAEGLLKTGGVPVWGTKKTLGIGSGFKGHRKDTSPSVASHILRHTHMVSPCRQRVYPNGKFRDTCVSVSPRVTLNRCCTSLTNTDQNQTYFFWLKTKAQMSISEKFARNSIHSLFWVFGQCPADIPVAGFYDYVQATQLARSFKREPPQKWLVGYEPPPNSDVQPRVPNQNSSPLALKTRHPFKLSRTLKKSTDPPRF